MTQDDFSTYPVAEQTGEELAAELPEDTGAPNRTPRTAAMRQPPGPAAKTGLPGTKS